MTERPPRIVLIGLPGSGKSTVGAGLARKLGWQFHDFDPLIETEAGRSIREIFATEGEAGFRQRERELSERLAVEASQPFVAAPGGGWAAQDGLVEGLRHPGRLVHLRVSPGEAIRRLGTDGGGRPLLAGGGAESRLARLAAERERYYRQADLEIDVENIAVNEVIDRLAIVASSLGVR